MIRIKRKLLDSCEDISLWNVQNSIGDAKCISNFIFSKQINLNAVDAKQLYRAMNYFQILCY